MIEDYLIQNGYADNYVSAQKIVEAMSDSWFDMICEAEIPWRERRGDRPSPSEIAAKTRARLSRQSTEQRTNRKPGDFIQTTKNLNRVTQAINRLNAENPIPKTKGMSGRRGSQEGGKPQTNREGMTRTGGVVSASPESTWTRGERISTDLTGISSRTTSTGVPLNSLGPAERTSWQGDPRKPAGRTSGPRVTSTGGRFPAR